MDSYSIFQKAQEGGFKERIIKERERVNELYRQYKELESEYLKVRDKKKLLHIEMPFSDSRLKMEW